MEVKQILRLRESSSYSNSNTEFTEFQVEEVLRVVGETLPGPPEGEEEEEEEEGAGESEGEGGADADVEGNERVEGGGDGES